MNNYFKLNSKVVEGVMDMKLGDQNIGKFISVDLDYKTEGKGRAQGFIQILSNIKQKFGVLFNRIGYAMDNRGTWLDNQAVAKQLNADVEHLTALLQKEEGATQWGSSMVSSAVENMKLICKLMEERKAKVEESFNEKFSALTAKVEEQQKRIEEKRQVQTTLLLTDRKVSNQTGITESLQQLVPPNAPVPEQPSDSADAPIPSASDKPLPFQATLASGKQQQETQTFFQEDAEEKDQLRELTSVKLEIMPPPELATTPKVATTSKISPLLFKATKKLPPHIKANSRKYGVVVTLLFALGAWLGMRQGMSAGPVVLPPAGPTGPTAPPTVGQPTVTPTMQPNELFGSIVNPNMLSLNQTNEFCLITTTEGTFTITPQNSLSQRPVSIDLGTDEEVVNHDDDAYNDDADENLERSAIGPTIQPRIKLPIDDEPCPPDDIKGRAANILTDNSSATSVPKKSLTEPAVNHRQHPQGGGKGDVVAGRPTVSVRTHDLDSTVPTQGTQAMGWGLPLAGVGIAALVALVAKIKNMATERFKRQRDVVDLLKNDQDLESEPVLFQKKWANTLYQINDWQNFLSRGEKKPKVYYQGAVAEQRRKWITHALFSGDDQAKEMAAFLVEQEIKGVKEFADQLSESPDYHTFIQDKDVKAVIGEKKLSPFPKEWGNLSSSATSQPVPNTDVPQVDSRGPLDGSALSASSKGKSRELLKGPKGPPPLLSQRPVPPPLPPSPSATVVLRGAQLQQAGGGDGGEKLAENQEPVNVVSANSVVTPISNKKFRGLLGRLRDELTFKTTLDEIIEDFKNGKIGEQPEFPIFMGRVFAIILKGRRIELNRATDAGYLKIQMMPQLKEKAGDVQHLNELMNVWYQANLKGGDTAAKELKERLSDPNQGASNSVTEKFNANVLAKKRRGLGTPPKSQASPPPPRSPSTTVALPGQQPVLVEGGDDAALASSPPDDDGGFAAQQEERASVSSKASAASEKQPRKVNRSWVGEIEEIEDSIEKVKEVKQLFSCLVAEIEKRGFRDDYDLEFLAKRLEIVKQFEDDDSDAYRDMIEKILITLNNSAIGQGLNPEIQDLFLKQLNGTAPDLFEYVDNLISKNANFLEKVYYKTRDSQRVKQVIAFRQKATDPTPPFVKIGEASLEPLQDERMTAETKRQLLQVTRELSTDKIPESSALEKGDVRAWKELETTIQYKCDGDPIIFATLLETPEIRQEVIAVVKEKEATARIAKQAANAQQKVKQAAKEAKMAAEAVEKAERAAQKKEDDRKQVFAKQLSASLERMAGEADLEKAIKQADTDILKFSYCDPADKNEYEQWMAKLFGRLVQKTSSPETLPETWEEINNQINHFISTYQQALATDEKHGLVQEWKRLVSSGGFRQATLAACVEFKHASLAQEQDARDKLLMTIKGQSNLQMAIMQAGNHLNRNRYTGYKDSNPDAYKNWIQQVFIRLLQQEPVPPTTIQELDQKIDNMLVQCPSLVTTKGTQLEEAWREATTDPNDPDWKGKLLAAFRSLTQSELHGFVSEQLVQIKGEPQLAKAAHSVESLLNQSEMKRYRSIAPKAYKSAIAQLLNILTAKDSVTIENEEMASKWIENPLKSKLYGFTLGGLCNSFIKEDPNFIQDIINLRRPEGADGSASQATVRQPDVPPPPPPRHAGAAQARPANVSSRSFEEDELKVGDEGVVAAKPPIQALVKPEEVENVALGEQKVSLSVEEIQALIETHNLPPPPSPPNQFKPNTIYGIFERGIIIAVQATTIPVSKEVINTLETGIYQFIGTSSPRINEKFGDMLGSKGIQVPNGELKVVGFHHAANIDYEYVSNSQQPSHNMTYRVFRYPLFYVADDIHDGARKHISELKGGSGKWVEMHRTSKYGINVDNAPNVGNAPRVQQGIPLQAAAPTKEGIQSLIRNCPLLEIPAGNRLENNQVYGIEKQGVIIAIPSGAILPPVPQTLLDALEPGIYQFVGVSSPRVAEKLGGCGKLLNTKGLEMPDSPIKVIAFQWGAEVETKYVGRDQTLQYTTPYSVFRYPFSYMEDELTANAINNISRLKEDEWVTIYARA